MLQNKYFRILIFLFCLFLFALIRFFENYLFYDPFLVFFKNINQAVFPEIQISKLFFNLFFRYATNSVISLLILFVIFKDLNLVKFASFLYSIFFLLLIIFFFIVLIYLDESYKMALFYIRRFLIQPIFILLFIPAFYFQKRVKGF